MSEDASVRDQLRGVVSDVSQIAEVRRSAVALATRLGFDETGKGRVALVVTELASNLLKHAKEGEVLMRAVYEPGRSGVGFEVLSIDAGPGITNVGRALQDGFSTAGSVGSGLGAIQRLASEFDLYSMPGRGTGLLARLWPSEEQVRENDVAVGVVQVAAPHERRCGDGWSYAADLRYHTFVMVDGLGHGEGAAAAADAAFEVMPSARTTRPAALLATIHDRLRSTRGAAVLIVQVDLTDAAVRHAGIGNVSGVLFGAERPRHLVSQNGIVGHEARRISEVETPRGEKWMLILHTDGISGRWDLDHYPGLSARDPSLVAGVLYRDYKRGRDDATVLVAKGRSR
jgi:anti-sigma regulatory factor (Ser/Thr protein kinase)